MNMKPQALQALRPNAEWVLRDDELEWLDTEQSEPTNAELTAKIAELTAAEPMRLLREERNRKIAETDWWASSDLTMTQAQTDYRQALRDITNNATSLDDVTWPTKP
tara:strand:+ start:791 stop:1111 length:321 start_codon:yes stop_codon:yes gene_type:complete